MIDQNKPRTWLLAAAVLLASGVIFPYAWQTADASEAADDGGTLSACKRP